ncbi:MAG TPA: DNA translocase FtsK 4TM domain-containing protein, partial [Acidimicrobiales bacterium]|nr:DNA translocase FtsK 4TM domain-containing protein [Acidimicrobiales bacterium]
MVTTKRRPPASRSSGRAKAAHGTRTSRSSGSDASGTGAEEAPGFLSAHAADFSALALITVGILVAIALYATGGGPVGRGVDRGLGLLVGWPRYLVPLACVGAGVAILAGRRRPDPARTVLGTLLGLAAVVGLAELAGGSPGFGAPSGDLRGAGGWSGVAVGHSLALGLGTAGAAVVLVAVALVAVVLVTGTSLRSLGAGVARVAVATGRSVRSRTARPAATPAALVETGGEPYDIEAIDPPAPPAVPDDV